MTTALGDFFDALNEQEAKFTPVLAEDNLGLMLRAAVNELDWYYYNLSREAEPTAEQHEQFYLLHIGLSRLIKLALEARPAFDVPTVSYVRDSTISVPILEIASGLGMIEHGRRVAQTAMTGIGIVEKLAERNYRVVLPASLPDDEAQERSVAEHYRAIASEDFARTLESEIGQEISQESRALLSQLVYPFMKHFIGYDAHSTLDAYFFGIAAHRLRGAEGYDSFHHAIRFGGVTFQKYKLALTFLISMAVRHERFAEALVEKDPGVRLENVLTVSAETEPFIADMCEAMNFFGGLLEGFEETTLDEARLIFSVLSVGRSNTAVLDRPGCALPLLVQCSDHDVIRCQTGAHSSPMQFLLDSLRHHFPRDYDKHQRTRERTMQAAMKRILDEACPGLQYRENINVRCDGRLLTDIDLVVMESDTGTILLVQLKHQDIYGMDVHSRHLRTARLKDQARRWLDVVAKWIATVGRPGIQTALQLGKGFSAITTYRVVLTRHYSFPLREVATDGDVAFGNWNQFVNAALLARQQAGTPRLADLVAMLRSSQDAGGRQEHLAEPRSLWVIDDLRFTVEQEQPDEADARRDDPESPERSATTPDSI